MNAFIIKYIPATVSYLFILLFIYAALSKLLDFENFQAQLGQSPLISAYAGLISYSVLAVELIIALLVAFPQSRLPGLYAAFTLMVLFTSYIGIMLAFSPDIPCSCGGILDSMGWEEHLVFNIVFVVLAVAGIMQSPARPAVKNMARHTKRIAALPAIAVLCIGVIAIMYTSSEQVMHYENPFQRRFVPGTAELKKQAKLHTNSLYFAGTDGANIYLGDYRAPLHLFVADTLLNVYQNIKIVLEKEDFDFKRVQLRVQGADFYLFDGTVPVIFKGTFPFWTAKLVKHGPNAFFTHTELLGHDRFAFRAYQPGQGGTVIGMFDIKNDSVLTTTASNLLTKQIDGLFDVDGTMKVDPITGNFIYLYFYRNQYTVANNDLELLYTGSTIDTNRVANLKISINRKTGKRQLAAPAKTVNRLFAVHNDRLYVNSNVPGKFENYEMWDKAEIIDVYDIRGRKYLSSFYVQDIGTFKLNEMLVINSTLYVLGGNQINKYLLNHP